MSDLQACRVCLAMDTELFNLHKRGLAQTFGELTAIPVLVSDGLPQHVCSFCHALLIKYRNFRARSHFAHVFLERLRSEQLLTLEYIKAIDRTNFTLPLVVIPIETIELMGEAESEDLEQDNFNNDEVEYLDEEYIQLENLEEVVCEEEALTEGDNLIGGHNTKIDNDEPLLDLIKKQVVKTVNVAKYTDGTEIPNKEKLNFFIEIGSNNLLNNETKKQTIKTQNKTKTKTVINRNKKRETKRKIKKQIPRKLSKSDKKLRQSMQLMEDKNALAEKYNMQVIFFNREEQIQAVLARKETGKFQNATYRCDNCYKGFLSDVAFDHHMRKHNPETGKFACDVCGVRYLRRVDLNRHREAHRFNYRCKQCKEILKTMTQVKQHFNWHEGVEYVCDKCGMSFNKFTTYNNHLRLRHGEVECALCSSCFKNSHGLYMHMKIAHREAIGSCCESCGTQFHAAAALRRHVATSPGQVCSSRMSPCTRCGDNFATPELLEQHTRESHKQKRHQCDQCPQNYFSYASLRTHWSNAHRDLLTVAEKRQQRRPGPRLPRAGPCAPRAGSRAPRVGPRAKRARTRGQAAEPDVHSAEPRRHMCEMCGKCYPSASHLLYHQRVHTGEKPFQCPECLRRFRLQVMLKAHVNTHSQERPHACPLCSKGFASYGNMKRHQKTHTGEKNYECHICQKRFTVKESVALHIRSVHMKIPVVRRARPKRPPRAAAGTRDRVAADCHLDNEN